MMGWSFDRKAQRYGFARGEVVRLSSGPSHVVHHTESRVTVRRGSLHDALVELSWLVDNWRKAKR